MSGVLPVSLSEAIDRGLKQNLGLLLASEDVKYARGLRWKELSALLPNVSATPYVNVSQVDLAEFGFNFAGRPDGDRSIFVLRRAREFQPIAFRLARGGAVGAPRMRT